MSGHVSEHSLNGEALGKEVPMRLWSHDDLAPDDAAPLLYVHDGRDYENRSLITWYIDGQIREGGLSPMRIALVDTAPGERDEWYGASDAYPEATAHSLIPEVRKLAPTDKPIVGLGASLGAIGILKTAHYYPGTFGGVFLQSTSFHHPELDQGYDLTNVYEQYWRVADFVGQIRSATSPAAKAMRVMITCGDEPNFRSFEDMMTHLTRLGHDVNGSKVPGGHRSEDWGKAFYPHLGNLLKECWGKG